MPRAGSHYNLGTSRGPDKIESRAGPCTWLIYRVYIRVTSASESMSGYTYLLSALTPDRR